MAGNYGEAGAIDFFGPQYGLPESISGHYSYYVWGPRGATGEVVIAFGVPLDILDGIFAHIEEVGGSTILERCAWKTIPRSISAPIRDCRFLQPGPGSAAS